MSTLTETKPWDLSHVLDFVNKLSSQPPPTGSTSASTADQEAIATADHAKASNSASHAANASLIVGQLGGEAAEGVALGDFGKVWQFLGTQAPTKSDVAHHVPRSASRTQQSTFTSKIDYTSDGAAYTTNRHSRPARRHPSFTDGTDGTDGDEPVAPRSGKDAGEQPLTKTQKKRMRRKERKEREAQEQLSHGNRPGAVSESEADSAFGKKTPARKASAHVLKDPLASWYSASRALPMQYAAAAQTAEKQRQEGKQMPLVEHKTAETPKKNFTKPSKLDAPRKNDAVESTIHGGNMSLPAPVATQKQHAAPSTKHTQAKSSQRKDAVNGPVPAEDDLTMMAINAVATATAALGPGSNPVHSCSNQRKAAATATPVQPKRNLAAQSQPVQRFQSPHLSMTPASVRPVPSTKSLSFNQQLRAQAQTMQPTSNFESKPQNTQVNVQVPSQPTAQASAPRLTQSARNARSPLVIEPKILRSGEDRHWALLMKLVNEFSEDRKHLVAPMNMTTHNSDPNGIHVFVDASNIFIGFMDMLKSTRGIHPLQHLPQANMSFDGLALLMERRRPVAKRVLAGSYPWEAAFDKAKLVGYELNIFEKVYKAREMTERQIYFKEMDARRYGKKSWKAPATNAAVSASSPKPYSVLRSFGGNGDGTETSVPQYAPPKMIEQGVDEILHLKILESIVDNDKPSTIVLATGDAAQAEYSEGFMAMAERALRKGWTVELVSWSKNISKTYLKSQWEQAWDGRFKIIYLDDFAEELLDM